MFWKLGRGHLWKTILQPLPVWMEKVSKVYAYEADGLGILGYVILIQRQILIVI